MTLNPMVKTQGCDNRSRPIVTVSRAQLCAIENAGDLFVVLNARQHTHCFHNVLRRLSTALARAMSFYAQRCVHSPFPVDEHDKLVRLFVNVYYDLADQRAEEAFLGSPIGPRIAPQRLKISCQVLELFESACPVCLGEDY